MPRDLTPDQVPRGRTLRALLERVEANRRRIEQARHECFG